ncbi:hypothetical protein WJX72_007915 [[Myrmecia] bisecta]|uniref:ATP-dependent DNA helicase n=1 Tax=[Myrmecia] bisecta TaxID=41462 RepID=A0AAW1PLS6_9CHLO
MSQTATPAEELLLVTDELDQVEEQIEQLLARQHQLQAHKEQLLRITEADRRAPRADWHGTFTWDADVQQTLQDTFSLQAFRPLQREVINASMQGRDVLCLLPSGGGKSLCYQLPALVGGGVTLVVSPLLSLIQDQVHGLRLLGIPAISLTSLTPKEEVAEVYKQIDNDKELRLLYATPERVVSAKRFMSKLEKLYKAGRLARIAIDEAHCCSQWGNDFRPDYKKLGVLKQQFPDVPILALTATATDRVCDDLRTILRIEGCESFRSSINRPNLFYEVRQKASTAAQVTADIVSWIQANYASGESGIVYCLTRKDCETLTGELQAAGLACGFYHADMDPHQREHIHQQWSAGTLQVIVATIAFGMGINKVDVRFVIHHSLSKSLENLYQESGRAGRDLKPAHCLLFYRFSDVLRQAAIVAYEANWQPNLYSVMRYASALSTCRRVIVGRHFGEAPAECSAMCDCCARGAPVVKKDVTGAAVAVVDALASLPTADKRATLLQLIDRWRASKVPAEAKAAKAMSRDENERLIAQLVYEDYLQMDFGFTAYATNAYLKASPKAAQLTAGKKTVYMECVEVQADEAAGQHAQRSAGEVIELASSEDEDFQPATKRGRS